MEKLEIVYSPKISQNISESESNLLGLINGSAPKNENEKRIKSEIDEIEKAGKIVSIPAM